MDLSFASNTQGPVAVPLSPALAVILARASGRQSAGRTAMLAARMAAPAGRIELLCPSHGAFHARVAAMLTDWQGS